MRDILFFIEHPTASTEVTDMLFYFMLLFYFVQYRIASPKGHEHIQDLPLILDAVDWGSRGFSRLS